MPRNLIISGGIFHPFAATTSALAALLEQDGIESDVVTDVDAGLQSLPGGPYAMVTINALRWGMTTGDKYEPYRAEWAYRMPALSRNALAGFVAGGGGLLGMHTASICFDDWPEWRSLLGGQWVWGQSHHPPLGELTAQPTCVDHEISAGVEPFTVTDEIYHGLALEPDVVALMEADAGDGPQPIAWARHVGRGRVVYDALGHDAQSLYVPGHARFVRQAAEWLLATD
jgi:type 1 glutamine amidotransferase